MRSLVTRALLAAGLLCFRAHAYRPAARPRQLGTTARRVLAMPSLVVHTNVEIPDAAGLAKKFSSAVAGALAKPESYCLVSLAKTTMCFGGDGDAPCAFVYLSSLGAISPEKNAATSAVLAEMLEAELAVPKGRYYINFYDSERSNMGFNGGTF